MATVNYFFYGEQKSISIDALISGPPFEVFCARRLTGIFPRLPDREPSRVVAMHPTEDWHMGRDLESFQDLQDVVRTHPACRICFTVVFTVLPYGTSIVNGNKNKKALTTIFYTSTHTWDELKAEILCVLGGGYGTLWTLKATGCGRPEAVLITSEVFRRMLFTKDITMYFLPPHANYSDLTLGMVAHEFTFVPAPARILLSFPMRFFEEFVGVDHNTFTEALTPERVHSVCKCSLGFYCA